MNYITIQTLGYSCGDIREGRSRRGGIAGGPNRLGYWRIGIGGLRIFAHRLAWVYMTGAWPPKEIDHIDGNPENNAFANLRLATRSENRMNTRSKKNRAIRLKGVTFKADKQRKPWRATIVIGGKQQFLGYFATPEDAHAAYATKAVEVFGDFARAA